MKLRLQRKRDRSYQELRRRMIAETSAYITQCLLHPELAVHIPTTPAEGQRFPPSMTVSFWDPVLLD